MHSELRCPIRHLAPIKAVSKRKGKKTKGNLHLEKNAEFFSPTSSVEDAEKALSGSLKSQPTPRGVEQGAAGGKTKTKYLARNDDNRNCKAFFQHLNSDGFQRVGCKLT